MEVMYDSVLGALREADGSGGGESGGGGDPGTKLMVCRVFASDEYGMTARLDADSGMEFAGYCAEGIGKLELYLVSADPSHTGDIVLTVGVESFTVPVTASVSKTIIIPGAPLIGRIAVVRDMENAADTLAATALVVDWRCFR